MIAGVAFAAVLGAASGAELVVALEPSEVRVGDRVTAVLSVKPPLDAMGAPRFPDWHGAWGPAEVLTASPPVEDDGVWRQRLELAFFAPGEHTLPSPAIEVPTGGGTSSPRAARPPVVHVRSVLAPGQTELEPAAPPQPLPWGKPFARTTIGLATAIAAAALLALWRHRRRAAGSDAPLLLSPLEQLQRSLAALAPSRDPEGAWVGLSLALRRYLGARLDFPAPENTTSEIQRSLLTGQLPADLIGSLVQVLRAADQVKFARHAAGLAEAASRLTETLDLAERLEAWLRPPASEAEAA